LELRSRIGGPFTRRVDDGGPLLLVADGSGLVPLMAMLRHRAAKSSTVVARLLISTGSPAEVLYRSELMRLAAGDGLAVHHTFTHDPPAAWRVFARRLDADMLKALGPPPHDVQGSSSAAGRLRRPSAHLLVQLGHEPERIPVEDLGPMRGSRRQ
jgi:ferredoxin-NADP reductase